MRNPLKFWLGTLTVLLLSITPSVVPAGNLIVPASAASVSEAGDSPSCTQTVGSTSGVTVTKTGSGDCVLSFLLDNSWTPQGVGEVDVLVVGGGGGGGSRAWGGGGGAGGDHVALRVVPLVPEAPWWTLWFILGGFLLMALARWRGWARKAGRRMTGAILVLASATPGVILGWLSTVTTVASGGPWVWVCSRPLSRGSCLKGRKYSAPRISDTVRVEN